MANGSSAQVIEALIRNLADKETKVELQSVCSGWTAIKIIGPTKEAVQHHIDRQFELAERQDCLINFNGPYKFKDGSWVALGEIITWVDP